MITDKTYIFEDIKKTYNLIHYAESVGYLINNRDSTKNIYSGKVVEMRLLDSSGSKIDEILVKYKSNKWYYRNRYDDQDWGSIIDFVGKKVLNTDNFNKIVNYLTANTIYENFNNIHKNREKVIQQKSQLPDDRLKYFNIIPFNPAHKYLGKRGILKETTTNELFVDNILMHPYKWKNGAHGNHVCFPVKDIKHKITGGLLKNRVGELKIDRMLKNTDNSNSMFIGNYPNNTDYTIFITETPIEALSYFQLYQKYFLYLATMGEHTPAKYNIINNEIKNYRFSGKIILANNNDLPGIRFNMLLLNQIQSKTGMTLNTKLNDLKSLSISLRFNHNKRKAINAIEQIIRQNMNLNPVKRDNSYISYTIKNRDREFLINFQYLIIKFYDPIHKITISLPFNNDFNNDLMKYQSNQLS